MTISVALFFALIVVSFPVSAFGDFVWECIGCDPFTGTAHDAAMQAVELSTKGRHSLREVIMRSSVNAEKFKKHIDASNLSKDEKERLSRLARGRSFIPWHVLTDSVPPALLANIKKSEFVIENYQIGSEYSIGAIKPEDRLVWMLSGSGKKRESVIVRPRSKKPIESLTFIIEDEGFRYTYKLPLECNNLSFAGKERVVQITEPIQPPAEIPIATAVSIADDHTIRIRLWDKSTAPAGSEIKKILDSMAALPGFQSRDVGKKIRESLSRGEIQPWKSCEEFFAQFRAFSFESMRGGIFHLNGILMRFPADFTSQKSAFRVRVCNGDAGITIKRSLVTSESQIEIVSPWRKPELAYPPSGRLITAKSHINTGKVCGEEPEGGSEFYNLAMKCNASNFHFVK